MYGNCPARCAGGWACEHCAFVSDAGGCRPCDVEGRRDHREVFFTRTMAQGAVVTLENPDIYYVGEEEVPE